MQVTLIWDIRGEGGREGKALGSLKFGPLSGNHILHYVPPSKALTLLNKYTV